MTLFRRTIAITTCLLLLAGGANVFGQLPPVPSLARELPGGDDASPAGMEVLSRGPIHEAFAEPVAFNPSPGIVVPKQPPAPVEELPPDQRPAGENVAWIPGYWSWDDDRADFLWVSGFYRQIPMGRAWIPGYWTQAAGGAQWVSGYWEDSQAETAQYLPQPPDSLEVGPSTEAPTQDQFWVPGSWMWQESRYAWRPGFWMPGSREWMWIPSCYVWTPRGYLFVNGFWDYPVVDRGLLFAPVFFNQPLYEQQGFVYSPTMAIDSSLLTEDLFVRPQYCHYYFGDYYGENYSRAGMYPWFDFHNRRGGYDPIYAYQRAQHHDRGWDNNIREQFRYRREHADARPARIFGRDRDGGRQVGRASLVKPLAVFAAAVNNSPQRFERISADQRRQQTTRNREIRNFAGQRQQQEMRAAPTSLAPREGAIRHPDQRAPADLRPQRRPKSPIISQLPTEPKTRQAFPERPVEPRPDRKIDSPSRKEGPRNLRNPPAQPQTLPQPNTLPEVKGPPKSTHLPREQPPKGNRLPDPQTPRQELPRSLPGPQPGPVPGSQPKVAPPHKVTPQPTLKPPVSRPPVQANPAPPHQAPPQTAKPQPMPKPAEIKPPVRAMPSPPKIAAPPPKIASPPPQAPPKAVVPPVNKVSPAPTPKPATAPPHKGPPEKEKKDKKKP